MSDKRLLSDKAAVASARQRLDTPVGSRWLKFQFDVEAAGRAGESFARFLGTGRYLAIQTIIVIIWILLNVFAIRLQWDPYPFILLNLAFSTQAAYAAPLILLAQNRQENRDRISLEEDRVRAAQTKADTEFLARELAALRIAIGEVTTRDYLRRELDELREVLTDRNADSGDGAKHSNDPVKSRSSSKGGGSTKRRERRDGGG